MAARGASLPGSAAEQKAYSAEVGVAWVRFAVIFFNVPVYWLWLAPQGVRWLAITISVVACLYAIVVVTLRPYERFPAMKTALWTVVTDSSLIVLWIHATGDYASPFYILWYLSLFAVTFRYDGRATLLASIVYVVLYVAQLAAAGSLFAHGPDVLIRCVYILLVGTVGAILARESTRVFTQSFEMGQRVQETERFRALAEANPEAIGIVQDERIAEANEPFFRFLGKTRAEAVGKTIAELSDPSQLAAIQAHLLDPTHAQDYTYVRPDGTTTVASVDVRPMEYQGRPALFFTVRDVTSERAAAQARETALQARLEVERLQEIDRFKTDFINTAAHELNTPLTPIKLQLHMLRARIPATAVEERRAVEIVGRNLDRVASLVQDMLDVARLQSGRLGVQPHDADLAQLVRDAVETFQPPARQAGVELALHTDGPMPCRIDGKRITQVLFNLLSNAVKFTPEGGRVDVRLGQAEGGLLELTVTDTGVGLTPEQAKRLFQPFAQAHKGLLDVPGTGLGLYISRGILERHGGSISVESAGPGQGATFRVRLPR